MLKRLVCVLSIILYPDIVLAQAVGNSGASSTVLPYQYNYNQTPLANSGLLVGTINANNKYDPFPSAPANTAYTGSFQVPVVQGPGVGGSFTINGTAVISTGSTTSAITSVGASTTSVTLDATDANRKLVIIYNNTTSANLYIAFGATASTSAFTYKIAPGGSYESGIFVYTGNIYGIWDATSAGSAMVTEVSP
jgi:hypothetical protein